MKIFLIDSENVGWGGVKGFEFLAKDDVIYYFSTPTRDKETVTTTIESWFLMLATPEKFKRILVKPNVKQYLDDCIKTELGCLLEQNKKAEAIIISKDGDYNPVIEYWNKKGRKVSNAPTIQDFLSFPVAEVAKKKTKQEKVEDVIRTFRPDVKEERIKGNVDSLCNIKKEKSLKKVCNQFFPKHKEEAFNLLKSIILEK